MAILEFGTIEKNCRSQCQSATLFV